MTSNPYRAPQSVPTRPTGESLARNQCPHCGATQPIWDVVRNSHSYSCTHCDAKLAIQLTSFWKTIMSSAALIIIVMIGWATIFATDNFWSNRSTFAIFVVGVSYCLVAPLIRLLFGRLTISNLH